MCCHDTCEETALPGGEYATPQMFKGKVGPSEYQNEEYVTEGQFHRSEVP
jgi:hypothetical protein